MVIVIVVSLLSCLSVYVFYVLGSVFMLGLRAILLFLRFSEPSDLTYETGLYVCLILLILDCYFTNCIHIFTP